MKPPPRSVLLVGVWTRTGAVLGSAEQLRDEISVFIHTNWAAAVPAYRIDAVAGTTDAVGRADWCAALAARNDWNWAVIGPAPQSEYEFWLKPSQ